MTPDAMQSSQNWTIEKVYRAVEHGTTDSTEAKCLVALRHWFHELVKFDERTGDAEPKSLASVCECLTIATAEHSENYCKDRFHRVLKHARRPLSELFRHLVEGLSREQAMLPLHAVRELDTGSFAALSRRPGRTIREKLAAKPYMLAVRRRGTLDTTENRLLKALCKRFSELLLLRADYFGEIELQKNTELLQSIQSWLHTQEPQEIGRWENLPPNNALLQHRNYRRLWNAWLWAQSLDEDIQRDWENRRQHWAIMLFWTVVARLNEHPEFRFAEQPCYFDYDLFRIRPGLTESDLLAKVNFLRIPQLPPAHVSVKVSQINRNGFGYAHADRGKKLLISAKDFVTSDVFNNLKAGDVLAYSLQQTKDGASRRHITLSSSPIASAVELTSDLRIQFRLGATSKALTAQVVIAERGTIAINMGGRSFTTLLTPEGSATITDLLLAELLPVVANRSAGSPQTEPVKSRASRHAVVDLTALRPRFANEHGVGVMSMRLLWQRWEQADEGTVEFCLPNCNAVSIHPDAKAVSILHLLGQNGNERIEESVLSQAAKSFAGQICDFINTDSLTYLVPDSADDFSLETLRRSLNLRFATAEPLPRSIATVFDWHSSDDFSRRDIRTGDCVWVLDVVGTCLCVTQLIAGHSSKLQKRLPVTHGIYWERCPTIQGKSSISSFDVATNSLEKCNCPNPQELANLCGLQGLLDEKDTVSFLYPNQEWFTPPPISTLSA